MKVRSLGPIVASCVLVLFVYGCTTVEQESGAGKRLSSQVARKKENDYCTWTFDEDPNSVHKIIKKSLKVKDRTGFEGKCGTYESGDQLYIGDSAANVKKILAPPDAEFVTEGTCRYCYINASGGMSCVTYPGC